MEQDERLKRRDKIARDILILSRNTLLVNLRFLDAALSQFEYIPIESSTMLTQGRNIFFNPKHIIDCYRNDKNIPVRDYLHLVLHCIFCHMYMDPSLNRTYWDLACDIAVENTINDLGIKTVECIRAQRQQEILQGIRGDLNTITAEKLYHYLRETHPDQSQVAELRSLFYADDHEMWYMTATEIQEIYGGPSQAEKGSGEPAERFSTISKSELENVWKSISERMQTDLETFGKQKGYGAGSLTQNLQELNRKRYDYTEFLKKFAVLGEVMKIDDDEFDYIFYTYGLQLYGNMPLIEPLEYKEVKRIREFVLAIDTSGSTSGELVQSFVQKTYNILKSTDSFFSKVNLHIIQCDADIQEDVKITTQEEFDEYIQTMEIHGLGGTDFRPVFRYVDQLIERGEFSNLKGLIYFTDGFGNFPRSQPDYSTAFVFLDDDYFNPDVPPWAIKLVLRQDEI